MATLGTRNGDVCGKEIEIFHTERLNQPQVYCDVEWFAMGHRNRLIANALYVERKCV